MKLYHVNPENGNAGVCTAEKGRCRFGKSDEHYTSEEAARGSYEAKQQAFRDAHKDDLQFYAPGWSGKLPKRLEGQLARKAAAIEAQLKELESKTVEGPLSALQPSVYPIRSRGVELIETSELPTYDGDEQYLLALTSRQGGGNRECLCDSDDGHEDDCLALNNEILEDHPQFLFYEDDDFDSTYTTHYYSTNFTPYDVAVMSLSRSYSAEAAELKMKLLKLKGGVNPPWSILGENYEAYNRYSRLKSSKESTEKTLREANDELSKFAKLEAIIQEQRSFTDDELSGFEDLVKRGYDRGSGFKDAHRGLLSRKEALRVSQARHDQAEALPAGELRDYLIGDRGTGSYQVEEKVGRRKTTVTKTYAKGSLLGKELEDSKRYYATSEKTFQSGLESMKERLKQTQDKKKSAEDTLANLNYSREEAWANGWPSTYGAVPPIPESF